MSKRTEKDVSRRDLLVATATVAALGTLPARAASKVAEDITTASIQQAEWLSGVAFTESERELMLADVQERLASFERIRAIKLDNGVAPALHFLTPTVEPIPQTKTDRRPTAVSRPDNLAYTPVRELSKMIRNRVVTSTELTQLAIARLRQHNPTLKCVITLLEDQALKTAALRDAETAAGEIRGPLHGIPWGAKDLLAEPSARTTWGATPYRNQVRNETAAVIERLNDAGAVLVAKLSVGALAWGDVWFDGMTRNPWKTEQGSSGSSAGSASAVAAGLLPFTIGTETWGSIVSPCTRCGVTGLRPTFGRVSRHGCMALSWSMDKIGPIARSSDDCGMVFAAIEGRDPRDPSTVDGHPFHWPGEVSPIELRIGYTPALFEKGTPADRAVLDVLRSAGVKLTEFELPREYPIADVSFILTAEAATAFDELVRTNRDDELVRQVRMAWPNVFRHGQLIPAVEYIRANRIRTLLMQDLERRLQDLDGYVCPTFAGDNLLLTNLTGHPSVVVPTGFKDNSPTSITFMGRLFGEQKLLALADVYQQATDFNKQQPGGFP